MSLVVHDGMLLVVSFRKAGTEGFNTVVVYLWLARQPRPTAYDATALRGE